MRCFTQCSCLPVVNDFLLAISCTVPNPTGTARAGNSQHLFQDPTKAGNEKISRKEAQ
jgi:hypothetical protein